MSKVKYGKVHPKKTMFLRTHAGTVTDPDTGIEVYDMSFGMQGSPIIESKRTGQYFTLSWHDIIALAIAAGIEDEPEDD